MGTGRVANRIPRRDGRHIKRAEFAAGGLHLAEPPNSEVPVRGQRVNRNDAPRSRCFHTIGEGILVSRSRVISSLGNVTRESIGGTRRFDPLTYDRGRDATLGIKPGAQSHSGSGPISHSIRIGVIERVNGRSAIERTISIGVGYGRGAQFLFRLDEKPHIPWAINRAEPQERAVRFVGAGAQIHNEALGFSVDFRFLLGRVILEDNFGKTGCGKPGAGSRRAAIAGHVDGLIIRQGVRPDLDIIAFILGPVDRKARRCRRLEEMNSGVAGIQPINDDAVRVETLAFGIVVINPVRPGETAVGHFA